MNKYQIELLTSFLKQYKKGSASLESIIQHIDSIVDTKKVDTIIKLQNKEYVS
tara:strand:+ start:207 stop:365 length:159 start_codon:yes stop_codon:yes gene_type:complete